MDLPAEYAALFDKKGQILEDRIDDLLVEIESGKHIFHHTHPTDLLCENCSNVFQGSEQCPRCGSWEVAPDQVMFASRCPTTMEQVQARIVYTHRLNDAKKRKIMTRADLEQVAVEHGLFEEADRAEKKALLRSIDEQMKTRDQSRDQGQKLEIDAQLEQMRQRVLILSISESEVFRNSAEYVAEEARTGFYMACCTTGGLMLDERVWESFQAFQSSSDEVLVAQARRALLRINHGLPTQVIRAVARTSAWRYKWKTAKGTTSPPFDGSISTWDRNKLNLIYWSDFYDNVYQHPERPDDATIQDDEALGNWLTEMAQKARQARAMAGHGARHPNRAPYTRGGKQVEFTHLGSKTIPVRQPFRIRPPGSRGE